MIVDALKMYYTEILTHGIVLLVGVGLGMAIIKETAKDDTDDNGRSGERAERNEQTTEDA